MRKTWVFIAILLMVLVPFAFAAGGRQQEERSNLMVIITPGHENPFFRTAAEVAEARARALGYQTRVYVHNDDPNLQSQFFDLAIADRAAAIILDNAGADVTIAAVQRARNAGIPSFLITGKLMLPELPFPRLSRITIRAPSL